MSPRGRARTGVAIVGYAHSVVERRAATPLGVMALDTCRRAVADAGLRLDEIDGFTGGSALPSVGGHASIDGVSTVSSNWLAEHLGINPRFCAGFQGYGQIAGAVILAVNAIATGAADYVVVHRAMHNPRGRYHENPMTTAEGPAQWAAPQGFWGAVATIALPYNEYVQRYGATRDELATVVVEGRRAGARIPWSYWYGRPLSRAEYLSSRVIADPICMHDCDIPVDGAAAFVLTSAERAGHLPHKPVYVAGYAQGHPRTSRILLHWTLEDIMEAGFEIARRLWSHSGLGRDDVDLPQVYDGFSPMVYFWLESLGYCEPGEAHSFVQDGAISSDGPLPILSGGGAIGNGRMHGVPQMLECYLQLSGRAGDRQRAGATVGLACQSAPHVGGAVMYSSERL